MKIKLEVNEVAAILRDWAKTKYKTHNINCDFTITKDTFDAELEIIMPADDISDSSSNELREAQRGLPRVSHYSNEMEEPSFVPDFSGVTANL